MWNDTYCIGSGYRHKRSDHKGPGGSQKYSCIVVGWFVGLNLVDRDTDSHSDWVGIGCRILVDRDTDSRSARAGIDCRTLPVDITVGSRLEFENSAMASVQQLR